MTSATREPIPGVPQRFTDVLAKVENSVKITMEDLVWLCSAYSELLITNDALRAQLEIVRPALVAASTVVQVHFESCKAHGVAPCAECEPTALDQLCVHVYAGINSEAAELFGVVKKQEPAPDRGGLVALIPEIVTGSDEGEPEDGYEDDDEEDEDDEDDDEDEDEEP